MLISGIPKVITELSNLNFLHLGSNMLGGSIHKGIGNLKKLQNIYLDTKNFTCTIPEGIGQCVELEQLDFFENKLNGTTPGA